ncbi:hypothetical protein SLS59_005549 [Nothophoma quercina]|uniref:Uncharacterized protein n=1 Tax=Nothophoma quercina TaxID=749835 RepID=A0ABR3R9N9_9PLEO
METGKDIDMAAASLVTELQILLKGSEATAARREAVDILKDAGTSKPGDEWLHWGEYLVMYRIPAQAIRDQTPVGRAKKEAWRAVGVIGGA